MQDDFIYKYVENVNFHFNYDEIYNEFLYEDEITIDPILFKKIDVYESIKKPNVIGQIPLITIFNFIRQDFIIYSEGVKKYIQLSRVKKGTKEYGDIKSVLPVVCYNATFDKYKNLNNIKSINNIMYLDVDNFTSRDEMYAFKESIIEKYDWIIAVYTSVSKQGLHIIIKVDDINNNNEYNSKYNYINDNYFSNRLDDNAKSITRNTIVPFDPYIYINYEPATLKLNDVIDSNKSIQNSKHHHGNENYNKKSIRGREEKKIITTSYTFLSKKDNTTNAIISVIQGFGLKTKIQLDSKLFKDKNEPIYDREGWDICEVNLYPYMKNKIKEGQRTNILGRIMVELIWLNGIDENNKDSILKFVLWINKKYCLPPLSFIEVKNSFDNNWNKFIEGKIDFSGIVKKKRSFWSSESTLDRKEKTSKSLKLYHKPLKEERKKKIIDTIKTMHEYRMKITQKRVATLSSMSEPTVKNYWRDYPEIKDMVKRFNEELKKNN